MIAKTSSPLQRFTAYLQPKIDPYTSLIPERIITWKAFWGLLPFSLISTLLFIAPEINSRTALLTWLAISLFGHGAMAPFVFYFNGKLDRKIHIIFALTMGAVRGAVINLAAPILFVEDPLILVVRATNSALTVLYALTIASIIISIWSKFEADLRELLSNAIASQGVAKKTGENQNTPATSANIQQVITDLNDHIASAQEGDSAPLTLMEQANAIDRLINKHIRPHSAERWRQAELIWPKIKPWDVLRKSLSQTKMPALSVALLILPLNLYGQFVRASFISGIALQAISIFLIVLSLNLIETLTKESKNYLKRRNIAFVMVMLVINMPILLALNYYLNSANYTSLANLVQVQISTTITYIFLIFVGSIVMTVQETRANALKFIRGIISEQTLATMIEGSIAASTQSEYAQYLHAEVQSQLMACKLLLLKAAESDFTLMSPEVTQKVLTRLELLKQPYEKKPDRIPTVRLQELKKTWKGLAKINFDLPPELSKVSRNGEIIAQLIEELIVNAIRHGKAKNITVSAQVEGGRCLISVLDDGRLKSTKKSGLGSTLFEVFAPDWKLSATSQGTLATLTAKYY